MRVQASGPQPASLGGFFQQGQSGGVDEFAGPVGDASAAHRRGRHELPQLLAVVGVVRRDKTANARLAARRADVDALNLLHLLYSLICISFAVECWKQPNVPDSGAAYLDLVKDKTHLERPGTETDAEVWVEDGATISPTATAITARIADAPVHPDGVGQVAVSA